MTRVDDRTGTWRRTLRICSCAAAMVVGGCAGGGGGATYVDVDYGYGVYYASAWGPGPVYGGGPVYVGPPAYPPPGAVGGRPPPGSIGGAPPPHVSTMPARPMPPPRGGGRGR